MKPITITTLAVALGVGLFQPLPALAKDHGDQNEEHGKKSTNKGGGAPVAGTQVVRGGRSSVPAVQSKTIAPQPVTRFQTVGTPTARTRNVAPAPTARIFQPAPSTARTAQRQFDYRAFNRTNAYGGRWFAADAHPKWDRNRTYFWDNHRYRWYDGGWLIVDDGFWPPDYYGYPRERIYYTADYTSSATVAAVQRRLYDLGYYTDSIDGIIGPNTRDAIAQYQSDYGLAVTGRINNALLTSLGV